MSRKIKPTIDSVIEETFTPRIVNHHIVGSTLRFRGQQDSGKTLTAVAITHMLVDAGIYPKENIVSNMDMPELNVKQVSNSSIKHWVTTMAALKRQNTIVFCDEADQIFSHISTSPVERKELLPVWQTVKLGNFIIFIQHLGNGVDLVLRLASLITIDCTFDHENDCINLIVKDKQYGRYIETSLPQASFWFDKYNRWQPTY